MKTVFKPTRMSAVLAAALLWTGTAAHSSAQQSPNPPAGEELTLDQALTLALQQNRELTIAGLDIGRAQQRAAAARTRLLPDLSLSGQGGRLLDSVKTHFAKGSLGTAADGSPLPYRDTDIKSNNNFSSMATASITQPLTQIPRLRLGVKQEQLGIGIAREQQREQRQAIVASVRHGYSAILQTQSAIEAGEESLKAVRELARTVTDFVSQQTALHSDLLDVQSRAAQQELTLLKLRNSLAQEKESLNLLLGRDVKTPFRVVAVSGAEKTAGLPSAPGDRGHGNNSAKSACADSGVREGGLGASVAVTSVAPSPAQNDLEALRQRAMQARPDLRQAALQIQQAEIGRRIKQKEFLPDVSLAMDFNQFYSGIDGLPNHVWTAGFQMKWDPFDWGKRKREIAEQSKAIEQARLTLAQKRERAVMEVNDAARRREEAREQVRVAQVGHAAARERLRETMNRYEVREVLLKDALEAHADLANANRQVQEATLQLFTAEADVAKAVGED